MKQSPIMAKPTVTLAVDANSAKKSNDILLSPNAQKGCFNKQNLLSTFKPNLARMLQFSKFAKNAEKFSSDTSDSGVMSTSIPNLDTLITPATPKKVTIPNEMHQSCYGAIPSKASSDICPPMSRSTHQLYKTTKHHFIDIKYKQPKESSWSKYRKYALVRQTESSSSLENRSTSSSCSVRDRRNSGTPRLEEYQQSQKQAAIQYNDLPNIESYHGKSLSYHALPFQASQFSTQELIMMPHETSKTAVVVPRRYLYDVNKSQTRGASVDRNGIDGVSENFIERRVSTHSAATMGAVESSPTASSVPDLLEPSQHAQKQRRSSRLQTTFEAFSNDTTTEHESSGPHGYDNVDLIQNLNNTNTPIINGMPINGSTSEFNLVEHGNGARRSLNHAFSSSHNLNSPSTSTSMSNSRSSQSSSNGQPQPAQSNKMMVAPQPQAKRRTHNDENSNGRHHHYPTAMIIASPSSFTSPYNIQPKSSNCGMSRSTSLHGRVGCTEEIFIDGPQSNMSNENDLRQTLSVLHDRVRELESQMRHSNGPSTSYVIPYKTNRNIVIASNPVHLATQELMAKEIAEKEIQLQMLQAKLRECYLNMEKRHIEYDVEMKHFKEDSKAAKSQLSVVKSKLEQLDVECNLYKDRTNELNEERKISRLQSQEKIDAQEKEIASLRQKSAKNAKLREELEKTKQRLEAMEKERERLEFTLRDRERKIQELDDTVLELQMSVQEMTLKKSRESTPVPFDEQGMSSSMLENISIPGCSNDARVKSRRSQAINAKDFPSHTNLNSNISIKNFSPQFAELLLNQSKKISRCKTLVQCLSDIYESASKGVHPNLNRLLGYITDTEVSESETEECQVESISVSNAEKWLRKQTDEMNKMEENLDNLFQKAVDVYKEKMIYKDEKCHIQ